MSGNWIEDVVAEVERRGKTTVARATGYTYSQVDTFCRNPVNAPLSRAQRIARAVGMQAGEIHIVDRLTGHCKQCGGEPRGHYPMMPRGES